MIKRIFIKPREVLKKYIKYFIFSEFDFPDMPLHCVLRPDGYTELLIQNTPFSEYKIDNQGYINPGNCFMIGQAKKAIMAKFNSGFRYLVKFQPWGAHYFLNRPINQITDKIIDIETAFGEFGHRLAEKVLNAKKYSEAINIMQDMFESLAIAKKNLRKSDDNEELNDIVNTIMNSTRLTSVMNLLETSFYGERQLRRKFNEIIGMNPKHFVKIIRLNLYFKKICQKRKINQEQLMTDLGYYDRSHMIKEFKEILKLTPSSYFEGIVKTFDQLIKTSKN